MQLGRGKGHPVAIWVIENCYSGFANKNMERFRERTQSYSELVMRRIQHQEAAQKQTQVKAHW